VPDRGLRRLIRRHIDFEDLADAPIPVHLVSFDLNDGRELLLSDGPALDAIAASASIPGVFPPVAIAGRTLIDGGVVNNTPISHAVELGAERIYVLPTRDPRSPLRHSPRTALDAAIFGIGLLVDSRLETDIARYSCECELIVLPAPDTAGAQPTCFEQTGRLISEALIAARGLLSRHRLGAHLQLVT
jgi:NTE family protein